MKNTYYIPTGNWPLKIDPYHDIMEEAGFVKESPENAHVLLLPGGSDIGLRPERDSFEFKIYEEWTAAGKPVLGICRGLQVMLYLHEGELIEHIPDILNECKHTTLTNDWRGQSAWHKTQLGFITNSRHHQGFTQVPGNWEELDKTHDGIIEAAKWNNQFAVQWHPEHEEMKGTAARDWWIVNVKNLVK
jgi:gamma-glutamyl-gamma-aminobutyrate hydrolase PuuD